MMLLSWWISLAVTFLPQQPGNRSGAQGGVNVEPEANRVLNALLEAHGWRRFNRVCEATSWQAVGTMTLAGNKMTFQTDWIQVDFTEADATLTLHQTPQRKVTVRTYLNGRGGWRVVGDNTKEQLSAEAAQPENQEDAFLHWLLWGKGLLTVRNNGQFALRLLTEPIQVGNRPAQGLQIQRRGYPTARLYYDTETNLLVMVAVSKEGGAGLELYPRKYRAQEGIQVPQEFTVRRQGKEFITGELTAWKTLEQKPVMGQEQAAPPIP